MKQFERKVKQALREMTLWQFSLDVCFATPDDVKSNVSNFFLVKPSCPILNNYWIKCKHDWNLKNKKNSVNGVQHFCTVGYVHEIITCSGSKSLYLG